MAAGRVSEDPCPKRKVIQQKVPHFTYPYLLDFLLVRSDNVVTSETEDNSLPDLGPSLQVKKPTALTEVVDWVYETVLCEEVRHSLAPPLCGFAISLPR